MPITSVPSHRRGVASSTVFALLIAGVLLVVVGFVVGRKTSPTQTNSVDVKTGTDNKGVSEQTKTIDEGNDVSSSPSIATQPQPVKSDIVPYKLEPAEYDFGIISPGTELRGTIQITNITDKPLTVAKQVSSCKCTTAQDLTGRTIKPGESVQLNPLIEGRTWNGPKRDKITLVFAGYSQPAIIWLKSNVARSIVAEPPMLNAARKVNKQGDVLPETPEEQIARMSGVIKLSARDEQPFRILALNGGDVPFIDFDPATDEPRTSYEIRWDLRDYDETTCLDSQGNRMLDWWVVETDHPGAPLVDMRVRHLCTLPEMPTRADIQGRHWFPSDFRIVLDEIKAGVPVEFELPIKWVPHAKPDDTIVSVMSKSEQFTAQLTDTWDEELITMCRILIVPDKDMRGLLYGNCKLFSTQRGHTAEVMIIARVVE